MNCLKNCIYLIISFLTCFNLSFSQGVRFQPKFHNFTVENGLPSSETYVLHQGKRGYIWIGTDRGVARFDGYNFEVFTTKNGLTDNVIFDIYEDYKGRIWFITFNSKLCYFEDGKFHAYKYNHIIEREAQIKTTAFKNIYVDGADNVHFASANNDYLIISKNGNYRRIKNTSLTIAPFQEVLFWTYSHSFVYKKKNETIPILYKINNQFEKVGDYLLNSRITLAKTKQEELLLNGNKLISLTKKKPILTELDAISLKTTEDGVWIGAYKKGVLNVPSLRDVSKQFRYLEGYSVSSVLKDSEGGYWFSTLEKGIFYTPSLFIQGATSRDGLLDDEVTGILGDQSNTYVGFLLSRWQNLQNPREFNAVKRGKTHVVFGKLKNDFFVSADKIYQLKNGKLSKPFANWSSDFYATPNSILYGVYNLYERNLKGEVKMVYNHELDKSPFRQNNFKSMMKTSDGRIWIGTLDGLFYFKGNYTMNEGLNDPLFRVRISKLGNHPKWKNIVATKGAGIYFFEKGKIIRHLTRKDGLLSDLINTFYLTENGEIWIGSNKGLNHIYLDSKGKIVVESITNLHGLISNEILSIYANSEKVYIGTKSGISVLDRMKFKRNNQKLIMEVSEIRTLTQKYNPKTPLVFNHKESLIKIRFRTTNYRSLKKGIFQYKLSENTEWITSNLPEISLISPLPGSYNLKVKYMNEDGIWTDPVELLHFNIESPFYTKAYFYVLISLIFAILVFLIYRNRLKQVNQKHLMHVKISQLEQKALQAQMNPHFIFNALNSIQSYLIYEENEKAEKYLLKLAQLIRKNLSNSREVNISVQNEIETLERYMELEQMRFKNKFRYTIHNHLDANQLDVRIPHMFIQPFVENAIIHGFSTLQELGQIDIHFQLIEGNQIRCIIEDNGIGREVARQQNKNGHVSLGTTIIEERLSAFKNIHGIEFKVQIEDLEHPNRRKGTRISINLPTF